MCKSTFKILLMLICFYMSYAYVPFTTNFPIIKSPPKCSATDEFLCKSGKCIKDLNLCDGIADCDDGSDETFEVCSLITCPGFAYKCAYGGCIDNNRRCNGISDCVDDSDETNCNDKVTGKKKRSTRTVAAMKITCPTIKTSKVMHAKCFKNDVEVSCENPLSETKAILKCAPYYANSNFSNKSVRYCTDGTWDLPLPKCEPECGIELPSASPLIISDSLPQNPSKESYSWRVGVYRKTTKAYLCGASLISVRVLISVAHCFTDENGTIYPKENYVIAAGKHYLQYDEFRDAAAQYSDVKKIDVPNYYKGPKQNYKSDIAIITLETPFDITIKVRPVCIDWSNSFNMQPGDKGVVASWGLAMVSPLNSAEKTELEVPYIPLQECIDTFPPKFRMYAVNDKMCFGSDSKGKSPCKGDSGNGVYFNRNNRFYLIGILSVSPRSPTDSCDHQNALYTKISSHIDFISNIIQANN